MAIVLSGNYPRLPPQCRMLTPIFHPNIAPHAICIGDFQFPYCLLALAYGDPRPAILFLCRRFGYVLIFLLVTNWLLTLLDGWLSG